MFSQPKMCLHAFIFCAFAKYDVFCSPLEDFAGFFKIKQATKENNFIFF